MPRDIGQQAKEIGAVEIARGSDIHDQTERLRTFLRAVAEVLEGASWEIREAIRWFDHGNSRRARRITRPIDQAVTLLEIASRRVVRSHRVYLAEFDAELSHNKRRNGRTFNPEN